MMFANAFDLENYVDQFNTPDVETPRLAVLASAVRSLARWTDDNSDGWAYWPKPCQAARRAQEELYRASYELRRTGDVPDITQAKLADVVRPIKSFMTRQGISAADRAAILDGSY